MDLEAPKMQDDLLLLPDWLNRGVADIFPASSAEDPDQNLCLRLEEAITNKKPLRIKLGIDPTSSDIHLGHSILFRKLRAFQDAGHIAVLIIGDFTARIGDPTGKSKTRVQLSPKEIDNNSETYLQQLGLGQPPENSLLDFSTPGRLEVHRNSDWLVGITLTQVIDFLSKTTVGQMLAKEDFAKRYSSGTPISLHEFLYPLLQAYDSVAVKADLELGGTDQKFNVAMGRDLQRHLNIRPQFGLLLPILVGLDGHNKMSKSLSNTVGINEDPLSMYSKLEKISDDIVNNYLTLLTDLDINKFSDLEPRERQKNMALSITASFHGLPLAKSAQSDAEKLVSGSQDSSAEVLEVSISEINFPVKAFYILSKIGLCSSSSDAKRQIKGGAFRLDGQRIMDPYIEFADSSVLLNRVIQLGKKKFRRIIS